MKKFVSIILLIIFVFSVFTVSADTKVYEGYERFYEKVEQISFMDIAYRPSNHWSNDAVYTISALGIMKGSDKNFLPENSLTRSEALAMVFRAAGLEVSAEYYRKSIEKQKLANPEKYNNIDSWADGYLRLAVDLNILSIEDYEKALAYDYQASPFRKDEPATKGELVVWLIKALGLQTAQTEDYVLDFADVENAPLYIKLYYETAIKQGILRGNGQILGVNNLVTREEAAQIFYNSLNLYLDKIKTTLIKARIQDVKLETENETDKITNTREIIFEDFTIRAKRTYDLNGEAVDLTVNPENLYSDVLTIKHNTLPNGVETLNKSDVVSIYLAEDKILCITCFENQQSSTAFNDAEYDDFMVYSGVLYYADDEEKMVVIRNSEKELIQIPYFDNMVFKHRANQLTLEDVNTKWIDKKVYVFTAKKKMGTSEIAYLVQFTL